MMVKAVAEDRGWPHGNRRRLYDTVNRLARETGDGHMGTAFGLAGALDTNFYKGWLPRDTVGDYLSQVAKLVDKLEALKG